MKSVVTPVTTHRRQPIPRPTLPFEPFPLTWHQRGYFQKKIAGRIVRFTADAQESYDLWRDRHGRTERGDAPISRKRFTVRDAVNFYLTRQKRRLVAGELSPIQFAKCRLELERHLPRAIAISMPLTDFNATAPDDPRPGEMFGKIAAKARRRGLSAMHRHVVLVRACLDHAARKHLMRAPDYGDDFDPPSIAAIDKARHAADAEHGDRAWTVDELRMILAEAERMGRPRQTAKGEKAGLNPHIYAQCLLALFAAYGSDDCSALLANSLRREQGVAVSRRAKNGKPVVAWLPDRVWDAIDFSRARRAKPAGGVNPALVFLAGSGHPCNAGKLTEDEHGLLNVGRNDTIGKNFQRLVKRLGLERKRAGFKTLRAMCRTTLVGADVNEDIVAAIMGRPLRHRVDEYYLRGDLRSELMKAGLHIERQLFPVKQTAPRSRARRGAHAVAAVGGLDRRSASRNRDNARSRNS